MTKNRLQCPQSSYFFKIIVDSPHCSCGAAKTQHYFFECQRHNEIRTIMLNELGSYCVSDLNTLLFGISTSDFNTNYRITITVQIYNIHTGQ